ncbi:MAG: acyl-CoA dehydrogenase [Rubrivivax sp.]|nr:acyl-CoA dehydrogenase [Rubrivivax sp.]
MKVECGECGEADVLSGLQRLSATLHGLDGQGSAAGWMRALVDGGLEPLPLPAGGQTLQRWQALAAVAAHDLSLAKLYEGHTDALAILAELSQPELASPLSIWGVWAAEAAGVRVLIEPATSESTRLGAGQIRLRGLKRWCSGAAFVSHGLLTAWHTDGRGPQLVAVAMRQPGVAVSTEAWQAVGMAGSASVDVDFNGARARLVGRPGQYLSRPGFWQGGAGIAACWHGGATLLAAALQRAVATGRARSGAPSLSPPPHAFMEAALGRVDTELSATAALLREAARWIDAHPQADASTVALRLRLRAECAAKTVLDVTGTALGATPFCRDARFARRAADLPVFIRQSHGERDFAALGERVAADATAATAGWAL